MNREKPKARKNYIMRIVLCVAAAYAMYMLVGMQITLNQRIRELDELKTRVEVQRLANAELERALTMGLDENYIERYARDYLGYVSPDQRVFIDISGS